MTHRKKAKTGQVDTIEVKWWFEKQDDVVYQIILVNGERFVRHTGYKDIPIIEYVKTS